LQTGDAAWWSVKFCAQMACPAASGPFMLV